jgi:hypothetical protein
MERERGRTVVVQIERGFLADVLVPEGASSRTASLLVDGEAIARLARRTERPESVPTKSTQAPTSTTTVRSVRENRSVDSRRCLVVLMAVLLSGGLKGESARAT